MFTDWEIWLVALTIPQREVRVSSGDSADKVSAGCQCGTPAPPGPLTGTLIRSKRLVVQYGSYGSSSSWHSNLSVRDPDNEPDMM